MALSRRDCLLSGCHDSVSMDIPFIVEAYGLTIVFCQKRKSKKIETEENPDLLGLLSLILRVDESGIHWCFFCIASVAVPAVQMV